MDLKMEIRKWLENMLTLVPPTKIVNKEIDEIDSNKFNDNIYDRRPYNAC